MKKIILVFSCFLFMKCASDRTIDAISSDEVINLEKFQNMDSIHRLLITDETEPGEELMLCLTFIDKVSKKVLSNYMTLRAKALLQQTTQSVAEIGYAMGFQEPTNFIKFFKNNEGITPAAFRKRP